MPATSRAQANFFRLCEHNPSHAQGKCPNMAKGAMHDFAATKDKGLSQHVKHKRSQMLRDALSKK